MFRSRRVSDLKASDSTSVDVTATVRTTVSASIPMRHARSRRRAFLQILIGAAFGIFGTSAYGQNTYYYAGLNGASWIRSNNWTGGAVGKSPGVDNNTNTTVDGATNDIASFSSSSSILSVGINFNSGTGNGVTANGAANQALSLGAITLNTGGTAGNFLVGNNSTTLDGVLTLNGVTVNSSSNVILRNASANSLTLANTQGSGNKLMGIALGNATANVVSIDGTGNIAISSSISGSNRNLTLNASGSGSLILSGANTYSGTTVVNSGVMNIQNATALGTVAGGTSVATGAALQVQGGITVGAEALALNGTGVSNTGALLNISGANTYGGLVTLGSSSQINSDAGSLSLSNTGTITGSGFGLTVGGAGNTSIASIIGTGSGGLTKIDAGTLTLSGANTYTGITTISGGTLSVATIGNGGVVGNLGQGTNAASNVVFDGGTLQYTGVTATSDRGFTINAGKTATIDVTTNNLTLAGATGTASNGALTKIGNGTLVLSGNNTYTGGTTVNAGALTVSSSGSLAGGSTLTLGSSGTADLANANQTLGAVSNANTSTNALNFSANTGTVTLASLTGAGNTRFGSDAMVTGGIASGTVSSAGALNANISGTANVSAGGLLNGNISAGTVSAGSLSSTSITGGTNTITGSANITTLNGGTTTVGGVATIGTLSSGTANLNGATSSITTLNGGTVNLGTTALTVSNGTTSGAITGANGSLVKSSDGMLTLSGSNSYGGTTNVTAGTLIVNGNNSAATGAVTVGSGATLGGTGTIGGATTIAGIHNPGNSPGIQTFNSNLTYTSGAIVNWELIGNTTTNTINPSATFDSIVVGGNLDFGSSTRLNLSFGPTGTGSVLWADSFWDTSKTGTNGWLVYNVTGSTTNFGNFQLNAFNWTDSAGNALNTARSGASFGLSQSGGGVYLNYTISAVPEPSSIMLLSSSVAAFGFFLRRRKRNNSEA